MLDVGLFSIGILAIDAFLSFNSYVCKTRQFQYSGSSRTRLLSQTLNFHRNESSAFSTQDVTHFKFQPTDDLYRRLYPFLVFVPFTNLIIIVQFVFDYFHGLH